MSETVLVPMRDGIRLATDVYLPAEGAAFPVVHGAHAVWPACDQPQRDHRGRPHARSAAPRSPPVSPRMATPSCLPGHARPLRLGRTLREVPVRRRGRLRHLRLAAGPSLVRWPDLHHGPVLCGTHPGGARVPRSARPGGAGAGLRRLRRLPGSSGIRQSGAFELKQATWAFRTPWPRPKRKPIPSCRRHWQSESIRDWFTRMPWKPGHSPLRHHPDYEAYLFDQWTHGAFDDFWQQGSASGPKAGTTATASRLRAPVVVVGPVSADGHQQLHRVEATPGEGRSG